MSDETKEQKEARESKEREDKARRDAVIRKDGESDDEYRERQDAAVRRDTEPNQMLETLDAFRKDVMSAMDGFRRDFGTRLDKVESKWDSVRRDEETPEQKLAREAAEVKEREDKARRDAAEVEKEKARADSAVAALGDLQARLAALETRTPLSPEHADYTVMAGFQARADRTYSMHGLSAPRAMEGETPLSYRRRLVSALTRHSPDYKDINIGEINSEAMLAIVEKRVYEDADKAAKNPIDIGVGELRKVVRTDDVGRRITEFHGDPRAWMDRFRMPYRMVTGINRDLGSRATH